MSVVTSCVYGWDTHAKNFTALRELLPPLDRAVHALVTDLDDRGLLDEVAVVMGGEFGRTPKIGDITPDGRGHWSDAAFLWMAGGGLKTGQTIGATDARADAARGTRSRCKACWRRCITSWELTRPPRFVTTTAGRSICSIIGTQ